MATKKKMNFEDQLASVEKLISEMENGGLPLEETLKRYEEGVTLLAGLEKELGEVKQKLSLIRLQTDGTQKEIPLEEESE